MEISIKSASEMAKVSRNTIYQAIKVGKISRSPSGKVDSSEVLRVFGNPNERHTRTEEKAHIEHIRTEYINKATENTTEQLYQAQIKTLEEALRQAREQLTKAEDREQWQRGQIEKLTDTIKLLEAPRPAPPASFFARLLEKLK